MTSLHNATALDPRTSIVVEACAGSGKTWLLVSRILRLLLDGVPPSAILAITFTRKAAREMAWRLEDGLRLLARGEEESVAAYLREREISPHDIPALTEKARGLLEATLTARPGITISTFHSWFLELLQRAPIEQSLGAMTLVESSSRLLRDAWTEFGERLAVGRDSRLVSAFDYLVSRYELSGTRSLMNGFVGYRAEWWAFTAGQRDPVSWALQRLAEDMVVSPDDDPKAASFGDESLGEALREFADLLDRNGTKTDSAFARSIRAALDQWQSDPATAFEAVRESVLKTTGEPRGRKPSLALAQRLGAAGQDRYLALHDRLCRHVLDTRAALADQSTYRVNEAAFVCGAALLDGFQSLKAARGLIDFADVEWQLSALLTRSDDAAYLLHRMDSRYRHILVDEFQDTNPLQWQALLAWIEASAEAGHRPGAFLVGDPKQSIYRFRRAEARLFDRAARYLETHYAAIRFRQDESRRCAAPILEIVNRVFLNEATYDGFREHAAHSATLPGRVELLPLERAAVSNSAGAAASAGELRDPLTTPRSDSGERGREREAARVAARIGAIVGHWAVRGGHVDRPARFGDIMILARNRTHLLVFESALRAARIPYATARHGGLLQRLETEDLQALLRFLATPFSDLDLARALRSPVFSCPDDDLIALAAAGTGTWWERLGTCVSGGAASPSLHRAHALLAGWIEALDHLPVHDLLDRIYHESDAIARYRAAVPDAAREAVTANLHAFVELALALDAGRYPSLPGFLDALRELEDGDAQEAPDEGVPDDVGDAVRILTIHGAKGLEAPVVFLIDAHTGPRTDSYHALVDWPPDEPRPSHFSLRTRSEDDGPLQRRVLDEDRRLAAREELNALYVAMTRARQCLIVSGNEGAKRPSGTTWYRRVEAALDATTDEGAVHGETLPDADVPRPPDVSAETRVPAEWTTPRPVGARGNAFRSPQTDRGERIHALLQYLAPPSPQTDPEAIRQRLGVPATVFEADLTTARAILDHPALARFFDPARYLSARNEVPCAGPDGELRRMDRIVEFAEEVWVLDYKTGERRGGGGRTAVPPDYIAQMQDYGAIATALWPRKRVRTALLYGDGTLVEIEDSAGGRGLSSSPVDSDRSRQP